MKSRRAKKSKRGGGSDRYYGHPRRYVQEKTKQIKDLNRGQGLASRAYASVRKTVGMPRTVNQQWYHDQRVTLRRKIASRKREYDYKYLKELGDKDSEDWREDNNW